MGYICCFPQMACILLDVHPTAVVLLQSLLFLLQPLKQAPAGLPAPSSPRSAMLPAYRAGLTAPPYSHRSPSHPSTHPQSHTCCYSRATANEPVNPRTVVLPSVWETTAESSLPPCRSLPRPRRRPLPWCSRRGVVNMVNNRHASEVDCTWRG